MELQERIAVPIFTEVDRDVFLKEIYPARRPAVLRGVDLGPCVERWTLEYLGMKGGGREVKIHVSSVPQMDFLHKNFVYRTLPFNEFVRRAAETKHSDFFLAEDESYYLRSLGEDVRKEPADLSKQFPDLAGDFHIPRFFGPDQFFSSVFRISSCGLQLWTHYDVMDNLLAQVTGRKRVVLYRPQDAPHLYLNGDKSEVLDIDAPDLKRFPEFVKAKRYDCVLEPGDLLFIPGRKILASHPRNASLTQTSPTLSRLPQRCGSITPSLCTLGSVSTSSGATCRPPPTTGRTPTATKTRWPLLELCRLWRGLCMLWTSFRRTTGTSTAGGWSSASRTGPTVIIRMQKLQYPEVCPTNLDERAKIYETTATKNIHFFV
ncbi:tRNA wybutosine-synthesizing protein 5 isoform 1-T1 [Anableps anableps]